MGSRFNFSRRNFMTTASVAAAGSALIPKRLLAQDPIVDAMRPTGKNTGREKVAWKARPFPMKQVRLGDGGHGPCSATTVGVTGPAPRRRWAPCGHRITFMTTWSCFHDQPVS